MSRLSSYHHGNLAAALVDEGVVQVRALGADKVSLRALATEVGVSPSAAYQHFGDKDELLLAVGQRGFELLGERMRAGIAAVPGDGDAAALAELEATGAAYVGFAADEPHLFRLMFGPLCHKPEGDDGPAGHRTSTAFGILEQQLSDLDARGLLRAPADDALKLLIWSVVHGFSSLVIEGQIEVDSAQPLFDTLRGLVLNAPGADAV